MTSFVPQTQYGKYW